MTLHRHLTWLILTALFAAAGSAQAATMSFTRGLSFSTSGGDIWGSGSSSSFGASGSAGTTIAGVDVGGSYSFSADTGSAHASLSGSLKAVYEDQIEAPGITPVSLKFLGSSGSFSTHLGAEARIRGSVHDVPFFGPWDPCIYCEDWSLDTSKSFVPTFGQQRSDTDSFAVAGVGPDIGVASAQLTLNANQTTRFTPDALTGSLRATHRDSGATEIVGFSLSGASVLDFDLDEAGFWDFDFLSLDIASTLRATIGASLSIDLECCFGLGKSFPFNGIDLLNTTGSLDFGSKTVANAFSILVVPEPGSRALALTSLAGLFWMGRRRNAPVMAVNDRER